MNRLASIDLLRGLIIVLMAIDHASYFIAKVHFGEFWGLPLPVHESALSFLTRWITHLAAPGFSLLMGCSIVFLVTARTKAGWTDWQIRKHLMLRGSLLIVLQHVLENPAWLLGTLGASEAATTTVVPGGGNPPLLHFGVLYGLGISMIICAWLIRLPTWLLLIFGIGATLLTQWLVPPASEANALFAPLQRLLYVPGHSDVWQVYYPLLPWCAVATLGMVFGRLLQANPERILNASGAFGCALLAAFAVLRVTGGFGNIHNPDLSSWMGFLHVTKYPPSIAFLLLTLGINFVLLYLLHLCRTALQPANSPLMVFGQTALGFYLMHLYVYAVLGFAFPTGASPITMYTMWGIGLLILYPLCRRYRSYKQQTPSSSVWRMF